MLDKYFSFRFHYFVLVFAVFGIAVGLPLSKPIMSMGTMLLMLNFLVQADFKSYWENWKSNKVFIWFAIILLLHFISLLWSEDIGYGLTDIRNKLPLFTLPVVLAATPITNKKHINYVLFGLIASLLITSVINFGAYEAWWGDYSYTDVRTISLFQSHNRYALLITFGAGICLYKAAVDRKWFFLWGILFAWFAFYTFKSQILSGLLSLLVVLIVLGIYAIFSVKSKWLKIGSISLVGLSTLIVLVFSFVYFSPDKNKFDYRNIDYYSAEGNLYWNDTVNIEFENGTPIIMFVQEDELRREWIKVSLIPYDSLDTKKQLLRATLFRYMASKGLRKDAEGFRQLSIADIRNIEDGIPSVLNKQPGVFHRMHGVKMEIEGYFNGADPNGHSILQRLEHMRAAKHIIANNWIFGVGTGGVKPSFNKAYEEINSRLLDDKRYRAHNQYATIWIAFGIGGLMIFLLIFVKYFQLNWKNRNALAVIFCCIALTSFFIEDTLETQTGGTFVGLFIGIWAVKSIPHSASKEKKST